MNFDLTLKCYVRGHTIISKGRTVGLMGLISLFFYLKYNVLLPLCYYHDCCTLIIIIIFISILVIITNV